DDVAGHLAAGREGPRRLDLVLALDEQAVDVVHARCSHRDDHLARPGCRVGPLLDGQLVDRGELGADDGAHGAEHGTTPRRVWHRGDLGRTRPMSTYTLPGLDQPTAEKACAILQDRLVALTDLHLTLKHIHWNVVGPGFIAVHKMLDPQVDTVRLQAD